MSSLPTFTCGFTGFTVQQHSLEWLRGYTATAFKGELSRCQFCRISATITDAVRSCPQTLHFYLERLAMPRLDSVVDEWPEYVGGGGGGGGGG